MKDVERNVEALSRQVREAAKERKRSAKKKPKKKRKDGNVKKRNFNKSKRKASKNSSGKKGGRKKNQPGGSRTTRTCSEISCLNNLLQVLKIDKDTVQNFMQQKKRLDKKLNLASNKKGKSNVTGETVAALRKSLGGEKALKNNRPVCHGRYNITDAIQGQVMYNNISQCDTLVKTACNFSLPANETAEVEACNKVMGAFR